MKNLFRYLDRRLLAAIVLVVVAVFALRATWIGSSQSSLRSAIDDRTEAEEDLDSFRTRLVEIRSDGVTTGDALLERIARLEVLVPPSNDVLAVSSNFIAIAESSGVALESFAPIDAGDGAKEETAARVLRGSRYAFDATGDFDSLARFLTNVIASNRFVATIDSLAVTPTGQDSGMFGTGVRISGEVLVWSLIEKPLTNPSFSSAPIAGGNSSPATTLPPAETTETTVPGTETTVPGVATTLPASPTTLPAPAEGAGLDPRFDSCEEAIDAGFGPYVDGDDPEYDFYDDADGDGVVCEG